MNGGGNGSCVCVLTECDTAESGLLVDGSRVCWIAFGEREEKDVIAGLWEMGRGLVVLTPTSDWNGLLLTPGPRWCGLAGVEGMGDESAPGGVKRPCSEGWCVAVEALEDEGKEYVAVESPSAPIHDGAVSLLPLVLPFGSGVSVVDALTATTERFRASFLYSSEKVLAEPIVAAADTPDRADFLNADE